MRSHSALANSVFVIGTGYLNCEYRKLGFTEDSTAQKSHLRECGNTLEKQPRPAGLDSHLVYEIEEVEKALCHEGETKIRENNTHDRISSSRELEIC